MGDKFPGGVDSWASRSGILTILCVFITVNALVFFADRSRIAMAPALGLSGFAKMAPPGYEGPMPPRSTEIDNGAAFNVSLSWDEFLVRTVREGSIPLWDPYSGLGFPHQPNALSGVLYPPNYLNVLIPPAYRDFIHLGHWLLGAFFMYLYVARLHGRGEAAAMAGVVIVAGGWFSIWLTLREVVGVAVWFMFMLYAVERAFQEPQWRWRHAAIALAIFGQVAAGHPEVFIPSLLCGGIYALVRAAGSGPFVQGVARAAPGMALGLLLAAPIWLNFLEFALGAGNPHVEPAWEVTLPPQSLAAYFLPHVFGTIHEEWFPGATWKWADAPGWLPGAIGFFVVCGIHEAFRKREAMTIFWSAVFVLMLAKFFWATPLVQAIGRLPVLDEIIWPRYAAFLPLIAAAILTARGIAALIAGEARNALWIWLLFVAVIASAAAIQIRSPAPGADPKLVALAWKFLAAGASWAVLAPVAVMLALRRAGSAHVAFRFALIGSVGLAGAAYGSNGFEARTVADLALWSLVVFLAATAGLVAMVRTPKWQAAAGALALVVGSVSIVVAAGKDRGGLPLRHDPLTTPAYLSKLLELQQGGLYRTLPFDGAPMPNFHAAYGLASMNWIVPLEPNAATAFIRKHLHAHPKPTWFASNFMYPVAGGGFTKTAVENFEGYGRLGVRYFTSQGTPIADALNAGGMERVKLVFNDPATNVKIYENPAAIPRLAMQTSSGQVVGQAKSFEVRANTIRARYETPEPGLLVLTDVMLPGWTATLNGNPAPIETKDGVFRAIRIAAPGVHEVAFSYRPPWWNASLLVAALGLGVLIYLSRQTTAEYNSPPAPGSRAG